RRRAPQGCDCVGIAVDRGDTGALGETKREWPDAAEQVSDCTRVMAISHDQLREDRLACTRRLQERSWRKCDLGAADRKHGGPALGEKFAVPREPRKISALRDMGERCRVRRRQRAGPAHVDIEPSVARGYLEVERL